MLSCMIDATKHRDVATCDISGAFMQSKMEGKVIMKLEGVMADLIPKIDPQQYEKHTVYERGKPIIYVILLKALYGTLQAALLFWENLSSQLKEWGFNLNPYDFCMANKTVNHKQCTIVWHIDDLKISHEDPRVVTTILNLLDGKYGQEIVGGERAALTINRGKTHDYLGMTLDYSEPGCLQINMTDYVDKVLEEAPTYMDNTATTPADKNLFEVRYDIATLDPDAAELHYSMVMRLLFLCKRGRPDLQTAIAFLCTRVQSPTLDDQRKLSRIIKYLRKTRTLVLTLRADNINIVKWWVDAAFAVHRDMRSHTGGVMSMGAGAVYSSSQKQKMNTKSSTEAELVGANDILPQVLWTRYFLEAQGYGTNNILYQDNQSTMKMEQNGKASSGKRTRHINIRYFFITDRIAKKEVAIQYCPTKQMVADYFIKPLQGGLFYKLRDQILGLAPMEAIHGDQRSVLESNLVSTGNPQPPKRGLPQTRGISKGPTNDVRKRPKADQGHRTWAQVARSHRTYQKRNSHEATSPTVKKGHSV
jgi:hypothetical protein